MSPAFYDWGHANVYYTFTGHWKPTHSTWVATEAWVWVVIRCFQPGDHNKDEFQWLVAGDYGSREGLDELMKRVPMLTIQERLAPLWRPTEMGPIGNLIIVFLQLHGSELAGCWLLQYRLVQLGLLVILQFSWFLVLMVN